MCAGNPSCLANARIPGRSEANASRFSRPIVLNFSYVRAVTPEDTAAKPPVGRVLVIPIE